MSRKWNIRLGSLANTALALVLAVTMLPLSALAVTLDLDNGSVTILNATQYQQGSLETKNNSSSEEGYLITQTSEQTANTITVAANAGEVNITLQDVNISTGSTKAALTIKGTTADDKTCDTTIVLDGDNSLAGGASSTRASGITVWTGADVEITAKETDDTLTVKGGNNSAAIDVNAGAELTVSGGDINVTGGASGAGIGGGYGETVGDIVITGDAMVTAQGGYGAAGIGGGNNTSDGGTVSIGGDAVVDAKGGTNGAGIGGGLKSDAADVTISDNAQVKANGYGGAAGIGSGNTGKGGSVEIAGGDVTATGYSGGAGIGNGLGSTTAVDIEISGGDVTATGSRTRDGQGAAGIGGAYGMASGDIVISGGDVQATGGNGSAGIGEGHAGKGTNVEISGDAVVTAQGGAGAAGVGGASRSTGETNVTISGESDVTAIAAENGAGIGSGYAGAVGTIDISGNASVTAQGGAYSAGIGSATQGQAGDIIIHGNASVTAQGGVGAAGIGGGHSSAADQIAISGDSNVSAKGGDGGAGIGNGARAAAQGDISFSENTTVEAIGGKYAAGIGGGYAGDVHSVSVSGGSVTAVGGDKAYCVGQGDDYAGAKDQLTVTGGQLTMVADYNMLFYSGDFSGNSAYLNYESSQTVTLGDGRVIEVPRRSGMHPIINGVTYRGVNLINEKTGEKESFGVRLVANDKKYVSQVNLVIVFDNMNDDPRHLEMDYDFIEAMNDLSIVALTLRNGKSVGITRIGSLYSRLSQRVRKMGADKATLGAVFYYVPSDYKCTDEFVERDGHKCFVRIKAGEDMVEVSAWLKMYVNVQRVRHILPSTWQLES